MTRIIDIRSILDQGVQKRGFLNAEPHWVSSSSGINNWKNVAGPGIINKEMAGFSLIQLIAIWF